MEFGNIKTVSKSEVLKSPVDYNPLLKKVAALEADKAILVPIQKAYMVNLIKNVIEDAFKMTKYKIGQRTIDGQLYCFIYRMEAQ